jgi:GntR family transcriptional repressor for pyruvate dehydrogenase complex
MTRPAEPSDGIGLGAAPRFPTIQKNTVGNQALEAIKSMIVSGQLKPGQALPAERELAAMLGISRPSLREATRALSSMNVLEVRHGGGTFVSSLEPGLLTAPISFLLQIDDQALGYLFEVRKVIEVGAARLAAPRITQGELVELDHLVEAAHRVIDDPAEYLRLDFEIHAGIVAAVGNPLYTSLYDSIAQLSLDSRRRTAISASTRAQAHEAHVALVNALHDKDPHAAAEMMRRHIEEIELAFFDADNP